MHMDGGLGEQLRLGSPNNVSEPSSGNGVKSYQKMYDCVGSSGTNGDQQYEDDPGACGAQRTRYMFMDRAINDITDKALKAAVAMQQTCMCLVRHHVETSGEKQYLRATGSRVHGMQQGKGWRDKHSPPWIQLLRDSYLVAKTAIKGMLYL